jgi:CdiI immunity protein
MSRNHDDYYYLSGMLGYFHQDAHIFGDTNDDIIAEYIKTSWPYERLGLRADIERFSRKHPNDSFDAMTNLFSMAKWLSKVVLKLKATDGE